MAQVTIYLPDPIEKRARRAAKDNGKSVSRWIADQIVQELDTAWPKGVLEAAGAIPDFPDLDELRRGYASDAPRTPME
jgi:hypothetical protein